MSAFNTKIHPKSNLITKLFYAFLICLAALTYLFDLGGLHIPKNGDEYPYAHITRLTAQEAAKSGDFLPLQSTMPNMRNTKPPALFWQGILSTNYGKNWSLFSLRLPNVIYTFLTALLCGLLAAKLTENPEKKLKNGVFSALAFLAFFSTYRFGRPFLTNAPETFWLFLPFFWLLYDSRRFDSKKLPCILGIIIGIGLLYKSFVLLLPIGLALSLYFLQARHFSFIQWVKKDVWKLALIAPLALFLFSLWFVFDPNPQAIWQEFIVGENAGKIAHGEDSYLKKLFLGSSSIWILLTGFAQNAGLLALPVLALMGNAFLQRKQLSTNEKTLWIVPIVFLLIFCVPSQRSARYLLDAMPFIAILLVFSFEKLQPIWFRASLVFMAFCVVIFAYFAWRITQEMPQLKLFNFGYATLLAASFAFILAGFFKRAFVKEATIISALFTLLSLGAFLRPFDINHGVYNEKVIKSVAQKTVFVPYDFNAKYEAYQFLLPNAEIIGYAETTRDNLSDEALEAKLNALSQQFSLFVAQVPLNANACANCQILGERLDLRGRHNKSEINAMLKGQIFENLFVKEWIIQRK